jgi:hypothetical protein
MWISIYEVCHVSVNYSLSAWPSGFGRAPSCFTAHEFDRSLVQTPRADTVNQAVHPSGSVNWQQLVYSGWPLLQIAEYKRAAVRWLACWLCSRMAQTTTRWFPAVRTGVLRISNILIKAPNKCLLILIWKVVAFWWTLALIVQNLKLWEKELSLDKINCLNCIWTAAFISSEHCTCI